MKPTRHLYTIDQSAESIYRQYFDEGKPHALTEGVAVFMLRITASDDCTLLCLQLIAAPEQDDRLVESVSQTRPSGIDQKHVHQSGAKPWHRSSQMVASAR